MSSAWIHNVRRFFNGMHVGGSGGARSVPGGPITLYGTCYAALGKFYLGSGEFLSDSTRKFILSCQDPKTGLMVGPELLSFQAAAGALHDRQHLLLHLTCAAIPTCRHFGIALPHSVTAAHRFCDLHFLRQWLDGRDFKNAWFEGNNVLFVGQLLIYLRDVEKHPGARRALDGWFQWLDEKADPKSSLWGTDGDSSATEAVYGGYHQLLVYYHEHHPLKNPHGLVDTVLTLQHADGGFNPEGNGGACEDVDCVDILVNLYKLIDYRRAETRYALRNCLRHILALQNCDGGFPYNRDSPQNHMGVPGTEAEPNQSTTFATWFRVLTLALVAEILTDEPDLQFNFRFTNNLSMGWHQMWNKADHSITAQNRKEEIEIGWRRRMRLLIKWRSKQILRGASRARNTAGRLRRTAFGK